MNLFHEYLIRLDDDLSSKLVHFSKTNDMTITGTVRRSLRQFLESVESQEPLRVKNKTKVNENRDL